MYKILHLKSGCCDDIKKPKYKLITKNGSIP